MYEDFFGFPPADNDYQNKPTFLIHIRQKTIIIKIKRQISNKISANYVTDYEIYFIFSKEPGKNVRLCSSDSVAASKPSKIYKVRQV